jgi:hypothetical protein
MTPVEPRVTFETTLSEAIGLGRESHTLSTTVGKRKTALGSHGFRAATLLGETLIVIGEALVDPRPDRAHRPNSA